MVTSFIKAGNPTIPLKDDFLIGTLVEICKETYTGCQGQTESH